MGRYWSVEECGWLECAAEAEDELVAEAPEQRVPEDEPVLTALS